MSALPLPIEYLLVSDKDSKVLKSSTDYNEILKLANLIRRADGEVTIFRSLQERRTRKQQSTKKDWQHDNPPIY